ncbi:MAG: hypothetical protein JWN76_3792 [Chitinophagaceae bacterium]|nr:hypothetical protein [Chitinophagaceae bacterium]
MIRINPTTNRDLDKLAEEHYTNLKRSLTLRTNKLKSQLWLHTFLTNSSREIIISRPAKLKDIHLRFKKLLKLNGLEMEDIRPTLEKVFNYTAFVNDKDQSYSFAKKLQVNCCPYCNRSYTVTIIDQGNKQIVRPDFDHFFPKSKYPLFALSFFNLIPSCPICNRTIKRNQELVYNKYIHPYDDEFGKVLKFNYRPIDTDSAIGSKANYEIVPLLDKSNKLAKSCKKSYKLFKLQEIYEVSHCEEIRELVKKYHVSGGRYLEMLHDTFPDLGSIEELYQIAFGNFYKEEDFEKRPLGKLVKDIVEQLDFLVSKGRIDE